MYAYTVVVGVFFFFFFFFFFFLMLVSDLGVLLGAGAVFPADEEGLGFSS